MNKNFFIATALVASAMSITSCRDDDETATIQTLNPAEILSSVNEWKTTIVKVEATGEDVTNLNLGVVGLASYKMDGTYEIKSMNGVLRNSGNYAITPDGKRRILNATTVYNANGEIISGATFTRVTDITTINKDKFTYRISGVASAGGPNNVNVLVEHVPNK